MNKKRILVCMLVVFLLPGAGLFAAGQQDEAAAEETVNLIWYQIGDHGTDKDMVNEYLNEYLADKLNLTVDIKSVGFGDYRDKLNVIINAGEYYDIAFTASWRELFPNARKGAYLEIGDMLPKVAPDLYKFVPEFIWEGSKIDGGNYCVPAYKDTICAHFYLLKKPIVEKYNLDVGSLDGTLESFEPMFKILKAAVDNGDEPNLLIYGLSKSGHRTLPEEYSFPVNNIPLGFDVLNDTGDIVNPYENPRTIKVLETLHKYYKAGYIPAEAATTQKYEESYEQFIAAPQGFPGMAQRDQIQIARQSAWTSSEWMTGSAEAISVGSDYPEESLRFLQAVNMDEFVHNTLVYGIEGTHFEKVSDTHVEKDWTKKDYPGMGAWTVGTFFGSLWTNNNEAPDKWAIVEEYVQNATPLKANGFLYNPEKVQNEIAAVTNAYEKYSSLLLTGTANPAELVPEMLEDLKKSGISVIQADMQSQFDAWLKAN